MTRTVLPASAVPVSTGVVSLVVWLLTVGAAGALVSTVKSSGALDGPVLPAGSVATVVMLCSPWASGEVGVRLQAPLLPAVAVPIRVPLSYTLTVAPGSALPLKVGVVSSVVPWSATGPCTAPTLSLALRPDATGALVSSVKLASVLARLVLPAWSVTVALAL